MLWGVQLLRANPRVRVVSPAKSVRNLMDLLGLPGRAGGHGPGAGKPRVAGMPLEEGFSGAPCPLRREATAPSGPGPGLLVAVSGL